MPVRSRTSARIRSVFKVTGATFFTYSNLLLKIQHVRIAYDRSNHKNESVTMAQRAAAIINATYLTPGMLVNNEPGTWQVFFKLLA